MIVFDTNVVSELMLPRPGSIVLDWAARQPVRRLFLSSVSEAELRFGIAILPPGQRRERLLTSLERILRDGFAGRVLPFDRAAAQSLRYDSRGAAVPPDVPSTTPTARSRRSPSPRAHRWRTRDVTDFEGCGIEVVNPWAEG